MSTDDQNLKKSVKKMLDALELAGNAGGETYREIAPRVLNSVVSELDPQEAYRAIRPYYVEEVNELVATARMDKASGDLLVKVVQAVHTYHSLDNITEALTAIDLGNDDDWGE